MINFLNVFMKHLLILAFTAIAFTASAQKTTSKPKPKTPVKPVVKKPLAIITKNDSISYAFGVSLGQYLKSQEITTLNYTLLQSAISSVLKAEKTVMTDDQVNNTLNAVAQEGAKIAEQKQQQIVQNEKNAGATFLANNKKRAGVTETPSGLQYEILTAGTGEKPVLENTVIAHYSVTLINGQKIEASYGGEPLVMPITQFIQGWIEALQMMPVGSKWKLFVPSNLAYGDAHRQGSPIPGGATLIFEMELLGIKKYNPDAVKTPMPPEFGVPGGK